MKRLFLALFLLPSMAIAQQLCYGPDPVAQGVTHCGVYLNAQARFALPVAAGQCRYCTSLPLGVTHTLKMSFMGSATGLNEGPKSLTLNIKGSALAPTTAEPIRTRWTQSGAALNATCDSKGCRDGNQ